MPIYEYRCTKGHTFDAMQRMSEDPLTKCEVCGSPVQRVLHAPAVHFKGSGFYNTDYGTKKRARETKEHKESSAKESSSSGSSSGDSSSTSSSSSDSKSGSTSSSSSSSSEKKTKASTSSSSKD